MKIIGLTGGIATGKSAVAGILKELGASVIDADLIAREIVLPGCPAWEEIVRAFGEDYLLPDRRINRAKLGEKVFHDEKARLVLNRITHEKIVAEIEQRIDLLKNDGGTSVAVIDAALLVEAGMTDMVDEVWLTCLPPEEQIARLMARNQISRAEAEARVESQLSFAEKRKFAHRIIDTSGTLADTIYQVQMLWNQLTGHEKAFFT